MSPSQTPVHPKLLDNLIYRDWLGSQAGVWSIPGEYGMFRLTVHQHGALRVTHAATDAIVPVTVLDLFTKGRKLLTLMAGDDRLPKTLGNLRRSASGTRLALEAELQRHRLFPHFLSWLKGAAAMEDSIEGLDIFLLRFRGKAHYPDLALLAHLLPVIGPGFLYTLFRASASQATRLLADWAAGGEWERFAFFGEHFDTVVRQEAGTRHHRKLVTVHEGLVRHLRAEESLSS